MVPYPTLALLDGPRSPERPRFSEHPQAAQLEQRARLLADAYWSESVWLTGRIPAAAFQAVCSVLEQEPVLDPDTVTLLVAPVLTESRGDKRRVASNDKEAGSSEPMEHGVTDRQGTHLERELARMTAYARALETRCHVLWAYVPGNQGQQDPIVPFLAEDLGIITS